MQAIRATLLTNLFNKPNPQPNNKKVKSYYKTLAQRIFPCPDNYISFLSTNDVDKQIILADKIVRRLCYESNFAPPYSSMKDVFCIENYKRSINDGKYHPSRDHFLHIVNLYMLGIYIFFYNRNFYSKIIQSYKYKRVEYDYENAELNSIKDFISSWKYFCLYHDIGYSVELLSNPANSMDYSYLVTEYGLDKSLSKSITRKQILFEATIKLMSKIVFSKEILDCARDNFSIDNPIISRKKSQKVRAYFGAVKNEVLQTMEQIVDEAHLDYYFYIPVIYSSLCLKSVLSIFGKDAIAVVGFNKKDQQLRFICVPNPDGEIRTTYIVNDSYINAELKKIINNPNVLLYDDYNSTNFDLHYYINKEFADNILRELVDSDINFTEKVYAKFHSDFGADFTRVIDETSFNNHEYLIFEKIKKLVSKYNNENDGSLIENLMDNPAIDNIDEEIMDKIYDLVYSNDISNYVKQYFNHLEKKVTLKLNVEYSAKKLEEAEESIRIDNILQSIKDVLENNNNASTIKLVGNNIEEMYTEQFEFDANLVIFFLMMFKKTINSFNIDEDELFEYNFSTHTAVYPDNIFNDETGTIAKRNFHCTLNEALSMYKVPFGNKYDHGIISSAYYGSLQRVYKKLINNNSNPIVTSILINSMYDVDEIEDRYVNNYKDINMKVLYSISIHNLYPTNFDKKHKTFKTSIDDAFTYLCLIGDSLQEWNRPLSIRPDKLMKHENKDASESYDIRIENDYIILSEENESNYQKKIENKIDDLSSYLKHLSSFVRNGH